MGLFDIFKPKSKEQLEHELESIRNAQKALDERLEKKQVSNEFYSSKSMEYREKIEKLESKLNKM